MHAAKRRKISYQQVKHLKTSLKSAPDQPLLQNPQIAASVSVLYSSHIGCLKCMM